jgi:hypothetical protein
MDYDTSKVDEAILALLYLNIFDDGTGARAWKSFNWDAMNRLHDKGLIADPKSKAKSVALTENGRTLAEELFKKLFTSATNP